MNKVQDVIFVSVDEVGLNMVYSIEHIYTCNKIYAAFMRERMNNTHLVGNKKKNGALARATDQSTFLQEARGDFILKPHVGLDK